MPVRATAPVQPEDIALVGDWFRELADNVRAVDFVPARQLLRHGAAVPTNWVFVFVLAFSTP
jgi:hypothetical protein